MTTTGARLQEVGTTNRTHLADYAEAIGTDTASLLKVHTSNFQGRRIHRRGGDLYNCANSPTSMNFHSSPI